MGVREAKKQEQIREGKQRQIQGKEKKPLTPQQRKVFNVATTVIMVLAIGVFVYSGYQLYSTLKEYKDGQDTYDDIQNMFPTLGELVEGTKGPETEGTVEPTLPPETGGEETEVPSQENTESAQPSEPNDETQPQQSEWLVFYQQMKAQNPDYIGWIVMEDTNINYPMVQTTDNDYYLYRMFDRTDNRAGSLFADYRCEDVFKYRNTIIYGHNRYDGSMFANLRKYEADWFYNNHPTFYIYTEDGPVLYQIFSIYVTDPGSDTYITRFADDQDYVKWLKERYALSRVKPDVTLDAETDIVTLSTCVNDSKDRLIVHAKRVN